MIKVPYFLQGISNIFKRPLTEENSLNEEKGAPNYRGKIIFHKDLCVGCGMCIRVCAGGAITKTVTKTDENQEITMNFDLYSCTFCGLCKDFCAKKAIELTDECIMVDTEKENLMVSGTFTKKLPPKPAAKKPQNINKEEVKTESKS